MYKRSLELNLFSVIEVLVKSVKLFFLWKIIGFSQNEDTDHVKVVKKVSKVNFVRTSEPWTVSAASRASSAQIVTFNQHEASQNSLTCSPNGEHFES